ncbi:unnamed protein product [Sphenostylis stenocarpa]|uniref:starch synthase n=1 Tax=Sphenostylis stenocarpa TaxID=92480 RepID=A0AA86SVV6_9FABA|nr:unnamed protein product [Sphenostylis stenocarpa]
MDSIRKAGVVFTIHNLEFGAHFIGKAIAFADKATTVSPTYSLEVSGNPIISPHLHKFQGIINGIDPDIWDPFNDELIPISYTSKNVIEGKKAAKKALQQKLGLRIADLPLLGIISRLTHQKGIHLIKHAISRTLERGGQVVLLGSAPDPCIQNDFQNLANQLHSLHHDRAKLCLVYDEALSHLIYAGADFIAVPSIFEPCGLTQLVAMRYGSIPIVRKTGGLCDTVFDVDHDKARAQAQGLKPNGFSFDGADATGVDYAFNRAISTWYEDRDRFNNLCKTVMEQDWSWNRPALDYLELYHVARKASTSVPMPSNKPSLVPSTPSPRSSEISNPMRSPRSSEINNPMRRSFTGNPFTKPSIVPNHGAKTPANSPLDFSRRGSVGIRDSGGSLRDSLDDKENGKDQILKSVKVRSPAICSKGSKNFMSPTISASCKINESPRKKVLTERNEMVPSPVDLKSHVRKVTFAEPLEEDPRSSLTSEDLRSESETHCLNIPLMLKNDTDSSFESINSFDVNDPLVLEDEIHTEPSFENEPDRVNLDPTFKLSPTATPPVSLKATVVEPRGADPLIPPYDPKTNYLSPRPQFLHYKPKPRMELCRERDLEDSFISGSFSDSEVTEDTQSEGSQKELDVSSDETVKEEEDQISEPSPARRTFVPEESAEAKEVPKPRFTVRAKAIAMILLLAVAFVSIAVTDSPVIDRNVFEDFYKVYESSEFSVFARANIDRLTQFAGTNLDEIARTSQIWFTKLLSSISDFISDVRGAHNLANIQYYNLTVLQDYSMVEQYTIFGRGENEISETHAQVWDAEETDAASSIDSEDIEEEHYEVYEERVQQDIATVTGVETVLDALESEEALDIAESEQLAEAGNVDIATIAGVEIVLDAQESEEVLNVIESEQLAEAGNLEDKLVQEAETSLNVEDQPSLNSEVSEIGIEAHDSDATNQAQEYDSEVNVNKLSDASLDSDAATFIDDVAEEKSATIDAAIKGDEVQLEAAHIPSHVVLYLLLGAGTVLIAGAGFNWSRKGGKSKSRSSNEQPLELHNVSLPSKNEQVSPDKSSGPIEMDVLEDSCPSEASSFHQNSFYSEKVANEGRRLGPEKKRKNNYRRESLASSSSDYSMGSLTVYEEITIKQGHGDEKIITPVRRSSRIRNQATSPL